MEHNVNPSPSGSPPHALPWTGQTKDGRPLVLRLARPADAAKLIAAIDAVARERRYFLRSSFRHDVEVEKEFLASTQRSGNLVLVALVGGSLAGWVTLLRQPQEYRRHVAELGMGVLSAYRGVGVGRALLAATLAWAAQARLERIELRVRANNVAARWLYERMGFIEEGHQVRAVKDERGDYDDLILMAHQS